MYKVTLQDENLPGFCSGTIEVYTDSLEEFEKHLVPKIKDRCPNTLERYFKSKSGESITDYNTSDNEELNIIQCDDNTEVFEEKQYIKKNTYVKLHNVWNWIMRVYFNELIINVKYIRYKDKYLKIASFEGKGGCYKQGKGDWHELKNYGNKFIQVINNNHIDYLKIPKELRGLPRKREEFSTDEARTFVFIPVKEFKTKQKMLDNICRHKILNKDELSLLLADLTSY